MARAIWSGVISFGLVSVPVELYSSTKPHEPTDRKIGDWKAPPFPDCGNGGAFYLVPMG
jgi:hypothetical protein